MNKLAKRNVVHGLHRAKNFIGNTYHIQRISWVALIVAFAFSKRFRLLRWADSAPSEDWRISERHCHDRTAHQPSASSNFCPGRLRERLQADLLLHQHLSNDYSLIPDWRLIRRKIKTEVMLHIGK